MVRVKARVRLRVVRARVRDACGRDVARSGVVEVDGEAEAGGAVLGIREQAGAVLQVGLGLALGLGLGLGLG